MEKIITINNTGDKNLNVFISNYMNRSYIEKYAIRNIVKENSDKVDFVIYGCEQQEIEFTGVEYLIGSMYNKSVIVKDLLVCVNHPEQMKTTMTILRLDVDCVEYFYFHEYYSKNQIPNETIKISNVWLELSKEVMLCFEMKAQSSLAITFILNN